jgi:signal transduction histidine kinase
MANIQETEKDYLGSEKNAIQAIKIIQEFPDSSLKFRDLWGLYNLLAVLSERFERRDEAIAYYQKCIELSDKIDNSRWYYLNSINNMAYTIESSGDLNYALALYEEALAEEELLEIEPGFYVVIYGNIGRVKFLMDKKNAPEAKSILMECVNITEEHKDDIRKMQVYGFLADIYDKTNQRDSALYFSEKAYEIANLSNSNAEKLASLKLMGKLAGGDESIGYFNEHIHLSDSLLLKERKARDKFTRIEFETDEIIAEKEQISKERLIFLVSSIGLLVTLILIYVIVTQRSKNKALRYSKMQQEANEEIYNLMLAQQDKVEEGRTDEKKRISKELHDGVLGKLFGTRLSLDSLNLVHTDEAVKNRSKYIDGLQSIETEIRKISHDLSNDFVTGSSFTDIVSTLIESQTKAYQLGYAFDHDDDIDWDAVPNKTKMNIYRMLQETMQNIYKHAQATKIIINFKLNNDLILLTVEDDGIGFNVDRAKKGIGVKNINARAKEMGGYVNIKSEIGSGTLIEISIPKGVNTQLK